VLIVLLILAPRLIHLAYIHVYYESRRNFEETVAHKEVSHMRGLHARTSQKNLLTTSMATNPGLGESNSPEAINMADEDTSRFTKKFGEGGRMSLTRGHSQRLDASSHGVAINPAPTGAKPPPPPRSGVFSLRLGGSARPRKSNPAPEQRSSLRDPTSLMSRAQNTFAYDPASQNVILRTSSRALMLGARLSKDVAALRRGRSSDAAAEASRSMGSEGSETPRARERSAPTTSAASGASQLSSVSDADEREVDKSTSKP